MKMTIMTVATVLMTSFMIASCANAETGNKKTEKAATPEGVIELTEDTFKSKVYDMSKDDLKFLGNKPAIVDFTATWCGPCQRIAPILEELAKEYEGEIVIYKVDVDQNKPLAKSFEVSSIPAVMFIPMDGEPVMTIGSRDKAKFQEQINTILLGR